MNPPDENFDSRKFFLIPELYNEKVLPKIDNDAQRIMNHHEGNQNPWLIQEDQIKILG